jgi:hypothetical protein
MGLTILGLVLAVIAFLILVFIMRYIFYKDTLNQIERRRQIEIMVAQGVYQNQNQNQNQNYNTIPRNNQSDTQGIPPRYEDSIDISRPPSYTYDLSSQA